MFGLVMGAFALALTPLVTAPPVVHVARENRGGIAVHVEGEVNAPLGAIEAVIFDARDYTSWFPSTQSVRVITADCGSVVFEGHFKLPWPVRDVRETVRLERRAVAAGVIVTWRQERGDLRRNEGRWTLVARGAQRTRFTYDAVWQPRPWVPRWMLRIAAHRQAPRMVQALEARARARLISGHRDCARRAARFEPVASR